jgi:primosomal protein N' (replication factor Y) (superfamily II helicase)
VGTPLSPRGREAGPRPQLIAPRGQGPGIARVLPDLPLDKVFDYSIPDHLAGDVRVGTMVRVPLHGRRVGGWVVALPGEAATDRPLQPLAKVTGWGPPADVISLARWAAWRWAGRPAQLLGTASPPRAVRSLPEPAPAARSATLPAGVTVMRVPPAGDVLPPAMAAAAHGDALILTPSLSGAALLAARLRREGHRVALVPQEWALAAAGGCAAVGSRAGAWAPRPELGAVVVIDEGDEAYQEERAPTWNARDVAVERARRAGVPCVLTSPCPSLEALAYGPLVVPSRTEERSGWPVVEVVDRRPEPPGSGLYSSRLVALARAAKPDARLVCVLNRKGRARLLACASCRELVRCEACGAAVDGSEDRLCCRRCGTIRPKVCLACGGTRLSTLRVGVTRAREELELLANQPVAEVSADTAAGPPPAGAGILVGTEAVLHRVAGARSVAFLDFDQELLAPRYRAAEAALAMLARAARLTGGRHHSGRLLVQTRVPGHEVIDAALHADPSRLAVVEAARRAALRFPPETAVAAISGKAAPAFVAALPAAACVEVLGLANDRWLVRAPDHRTLCDTLAATPRPAGRLRIEVDPLRA